MIAAWRRVCLGFVLLVVTAGSPALAQRAASSDLRDDAGGRALLERFLGPVPIAAFGTGPIQSYAPRDWSREAETAWRAAERALPGIAAELGVAPARVLPIWILVSPGGGAYAREAPSWSAAIAQPQRHLIVISGPALRQTAMNLDETVAHEIVHLVLHARLGDAGWMPRWLDEGLAMRLSGYHRFGDRLATLGRGRIHLRDLDDQFPRDPGLARLAYLESNAAVQRLLERGPIALLLGRLAAGQEFDTAFATTYGQSLGSFTDEVYAEVAAPWRWLATLGAGASLGLVMVGLVVIGGVRIRRRNRRRMREWEAAETGARLAAVPPPPTLVPRQPPPAETGEPPVDPPPTSGGV